MVSISGSPDGKSAVDYTVNASVGFPWVTGPEGWAGPVNHVLPAWDVTAGMLTVTALLAAERHRRMNGEGQLVELALSDVAIAVASHLGYLAEAKLVDPPRGRYGNELFGTYARDFCTRDGRYVMVCALTVRQWKSLAQATGLEDSFKQIEALHGVDLDDEGERFRHRREISALLEAWIGALAYAEVKEVFDANDVLWGPYQSFNELVTDNPVAADPYASPIAFGAFQRTKAQPAPSIGADTEQVLVSELGLDADQLAELRRDGIISPPAQLGR